MQFREHTESRPKNTVSRRPSPAYDARHLPGSCALPARPSAATPRAATGPAGTGRVGGECRSHDGQSPSPTSSSSSACCCTAASARLRPTAAAARTAGARRCRASTCTSTAGRTRRGSSASCAAPAHARAPRPATAVRHSEHGHDRAPDRPRRLAAGPLAAARRASTGAGPARRSTRRAAVAYSGPAVDPVSVSIVVSAPREQVFDYLQDIANHSEFTDHYLVDWHLTRIDSVGRGAGARFRVKAPGNRFSWADVTFVGGRAPPPDRRGRAAPARTTASARSASTSSDRPQPARTRVTFTLRTVPATLSDRIDRGLGGALWMRRKNAERDAPPAGDHRGRRAAAGRASRSPADRLPRRMRHRAAQAHRSRRSACSPCSALSRMRGLAHEGHHRHLRGRVRRERAPTWTSGPLIYEVQLSRQLNPCERRRRRLPAGPLAAQRKLEPGQEWFGVFMQVYNNTPSTRSASTQITISDTQGNVYRPVVARLDQPVRLPRRASCPPTAAARCPDTAAACGPDAGRAAAVQDHSRLARQPPARAQDRRPRT